MKRALLAAFGGVVLLFVYGPTVVLALFSFNRSRWVTGWEGFTLDWYRVLFRDEAVMGALANSLVVAGTATVAATVVGVLAALAWDRWEGRGRVLYEQVLYAPIAVPDIVLAAGLTAVFGSIGWTLGLSTVIFAHVGFSVSYVAVTVRSRLATLPPEIEEAALDLGAGEVETLLRVTLPLILPAVWSAALLVFTLSIDEYVITSFTAGVGATTLPLEIYSMIRRGITPELNAVATLMFVVSLLGVILSTAFRLRGRTIA